MQTFLTILLSLVLGWGCSRIARQRGRNPMNWFIAGVFFGVFALAALFIFPRKDKEKSAVVPQQNLPKLAVLSPSHAEKLWYFLDEEKTQCGPMSLNALSEAWRKGKVKENSYVWNELMENWQPFHEVIKSAES